MRRRGWGLSGRLIASYILVTLAVGVLFKVLITGVHIPPRLNNPQLQAEVVAAAKSYARQLSQRYPGGVPAGTVLGVPGQPAQPGLARPTEDGTTLVVPSVDGPVRGGQAVTAVVVIADGTVVASSAPSVYPPGRPAAGEFPAPVTGAIEIGQVVKTGAVS